MRLILGVVFLFGVSSAHAMTEAEFEREHAELFSLESPTSIFYADPAVPRRSDALGNDFTSAAIREFPGIGVTVPLKGAAAEDFYRSMAFLTQRARPHVRIVLDRANANYGKTGRTRMQIAKAAFADAGIPQELIWIAAQESGFNDRARSHRGAVGTWQFMPATARARGLRNRNDLQSASRAAAAYLKDMFDGTLWEGNYRWKNWRGRKPLVWKNDWALAVSGYNSGEFNVTRAIYRYLLAQGQSIDPPQPSIWDVRSTLPKQTQHYLPVVLAWIRVAEDPKRFGF